ncbi:MAG: prolyl oligopeptidase family serine peptidase [Planctomycetota bacterium]
MRFIAMMVVTGLGLVFVGSGEKAADIGDASAEAVEPAAMVMEGWQYLSLEHDGETYPYAVYRPRGLSQDAEAPAILFLHGRGECGTNGSLMLAQGLPLSVLRNPEPWPAVMVVPQKPDFDLQWSEYAEPVMKMLDLAIDAHNVDGSRVTLTGLSQGGHGAMIIGARHADRFAKVAPVCGYAAWLSNEDGRTWNNDADSALAQEIIEGLRDTPTWFFHGEEDTVVPPEQSVIVHEALKAAGAETRLTLYPDVGHGAWGPAYSDPELAAWLVIEADE